MRLLAPAILSVVALAVISGCGSSRSLSVRSHASTGHYTVRQVEAAFAKQGIRLHRVRVPGEKLLGAEYPQVSRAERRRLIRLARRQTRLLSRSLVKLRGLPPHQLVDVTVMTGQFSPPDRVVANGAAGGVGLIHRGNLIGSFDNRDRAAVNSALAELH